MGNKNMLDDLFKIKQLPSMVQMHQQLMKKRREISLRGMLAAAVPKIGKLLRQIALKETDFNIDRAYDLILEFNKVHSNKVKKLSSERRKHKKCIRDEYLKRILAEERKK